jgi:hypothetical protein
MKITLRADFVAISMLSVLVASAGMAEARTAVLQQPRFERATFAPQAAAPKGLTTAVQMTKDELATARAFTGPTTMLADPENPRVLVAATANLRTRVCQLTVSTDGGLTWHFSKSLPAPENMPFCTDYSAGVATASIAWGRNGTLYYALEGFALGQDKQAEKHASMVLARTTDLGESWTTTVVDNQAGKMGPDSPTDFGASLAVDTSGERDAVYVTFTQYYFEAAPDSPLQNAPLMVVTSSDGGDNEFSRLTRTIDGKSYPMLMEGFFGAPLITAHNGTILVVSGSQNPPDNFPPADSNFNARFNYAMPQVAARSPDQGRTWTFTVMGPPIFAGNGSQTGLGWIPEGGPTGSFVASYGGTPEKATSSGLADILFQRSTDDGKTWSAPVAINDDSPEQEATNFYPQMGVAPNGRIDVVWQDSRDQTDFRFNVRYTYSTDAGATWAPNMLISDVPLDFNRGVSFNSDIRQPPGVASTNQYAAFGWADTRLADEVTETQDNFSAIAEFSPLPATGSSVLPILAAVFAGLVVAGLVLLLIFSRRRASVTRM